MTATPNTTSVGQSTALVTPNSMGQYGYQYINPAGSSYDVGYGMTQQAPMGGGYGTNPMMMNPMMGGMNPMMMGGGYGMNPAMMMNPYAMGGVNYGMNPMMGGGYGMNPMMMNPMMRGGMMGYPAPTYTRSTSGSMQLANNEVVRIVDVSEGDGKAINKQLEAFRKDKDGAKLIEMARKWGFQISVGETGKDTTAFNMKNGTVYLSETLWAGGKSPNAATLQALIAKGLAKGAMAYNSGSTGTSMERELAAETISRGMAKRLSPSGTKGKSEFSTAKEDIIHAVEARVDETYLKGQDGVIGNFLHKNDIDAASWIPKEADALLKAHKAAHPHGWDDWAGHQVDHVAHSWSSFWSGITSPPSVDLATPAAPLL